MLIPRSDPDFFSSRLRAEGELLVGSRDASAQRAAVYHHLYAHSLGNHVFPLLAAHLSIWTSLYLRRSARVDQLRQWKRIGSRSRGQAMQRRQRFAEFIQDTDRRVCVQVLQLYRLTEQPDARALAGLAAPPLVLEEMERCHAARRAGRRLLAAERRALFSALLLWVQRDIIAPALDLAPASVDWPGNRSRPHGLPIRLAYMKRGQELLFTEPPSTEQPFDVALRAFDLAEQVGWSRVESSLKASGLMPEPFRHNSGQHFFSIQNRARRVWHQEFLAAC